MTHDPDFLRVRSYLTDLQERICIAIEGATALIRTLCSAASTAEQRVKAMTPAFAAA